MSYLMKRLTRLTEDLKKLRSREAVSPEVLLSLVTEETGFETPGTDTTAWNRVPNASLWGSYDAHTWFRFQYTVTAAQSGKPLLLTVKTGREGQWDATNPQMLAYADGKLLQGMDVNHTETLLTHGVAENTSFDIALRAYAGLSQDQALIQVSVSVFEPEVEALFYDFYTPAQIYQYLPDNDGQRDVMLEKLNPAMNALDLRIPFSPEFYQSVTDARALAESHFYSTLPQDGPVVTAVGHTHIDVAWLWRIRQTREKAVRSFSTVLSLMERYPEYTFMSSQPQLYEYVKEDAPEVYERIRQRIAEGRWEAEGGMWLEADCNLASGEALVRQLVHGKRFFMEEFGIDNKVLWLPDVFGYSAALPQLLKKSGIDYFMTTKIGWNDTNKMPHDSFMWEGLDGTRVLTHFITSQNADSKEHSTTYVGMLNASQVRGAWTRYSDKTLNDDVLVCYGYGDGGGGPTAHMVEQARRMSRGVPGIPRVRMGHSRPWFDQLQKRAENHPRLATWRGELYLEYHRGTYTSMARNKKSNRKGELMLGATESAAAADLLLCGNVYPAAPLHTHWRTLLLNQFHDILPGSSIREVYEDSKEAYDAMFADLSGHLNHARRHLAQAVAGTGTQAVVFNDLGVAVSDIAEASLPQGWNAAVVRDSQGCTLPSQVMTREGQKVVAFFAPEVPAKGWKTFTLEQAAPEAAASMPVLPGHLENECFILSLDASGHLTRIFDKREGREVLPHGAAANAITAFEDRPLNYDAWDVDAFFEEHTWPLDAVSRLEVTDDGALATVVRIERPYQNSLIVQDMIVWKVIPRIDFRTCIDWKENQTLLKTAFPLDIHSLSATYDVQFGNVERPTHRNTSWDAAKFEVCAHRWADLSEGSYGVSLLNDCKYGHDIRDNVMRLTLLKSGTYPNETADQEIHTFTYSLLPHAGSWKDAGTVAHAGCINVPLEAVVVENGSAALENTWSFVTADARNVTAETVKLADDGQGYIVRFHEFENTRGPVTLTFGKTPSAVWSCDLLENKQDALVLHGNQITLNVKPYEVVSLYLCF